MQDRCKRSSERERFEETERESVCVCVCVRAEERERDRKTESVGDNETAEIDKHNETFQLNGCLFLVFFSLTCSVKAPNDPNLFLSTKNHGALTRKCTEFTSYILHHF